MTGGLPSCQWSAPDGRIVQAIGVDASHWAQSLPELLRLTEQSSIASDPEILRKLQEAAELVETGQDLTPNQACTMFSRMLQMRGEPAGTTFSVGMFPDRDSAQAINGQACSAGAYTSILLADQRELREPLPIETVAELLRTAHRRALG